MNEYYKFTNQPLPYAYDALEPYVDAKTMMLHHDRHLQAYIDNLNKLLEKYPHLQRMSLEQLVTCAGPLPPDDLQAVHNNAGGVYNHRFFFSGLSPHGGGYPAPPLESWIAASFGDFTAFQKQFTEAALAVFGSGYVWLVYAANRPLQIVSTSNQDTPLSQGLCPILCLDVWEHAYYLKHYNLRADYVADWFQIIDWDRANQRFWNCS